MAWLGFLELVLWAVFCFWIVDKVAPWLNDWLVDGINEQEQDETRAKAKNQHDTNE